MKDKYTKHYVMGVDNYSPENQNSKASICLFDPIEKSFEYMKTFDSGSFNQQLHEMYVQYKEVPIFSCEDGKFRKLNNQDEYMVLVDGEWVIEK